MNVSISLWEKMLQTIKKKIEEGSFRTWFASIPLIGETSEKITLAVPDNFYKEWIINNYDSVIDEAKKANGLDNIEIEFIIMPDLFMDKQVGDKNPVSAAGKEEPAFTHSFVNPKYTFESFVIGPSNRFAYAAAMAVAQNPARAYNPLFIYGGVGLGKTHLLQAIAHYAWNQQKDINITYISSEQFTNELIDAIQHRSTKAFRNKYRNVDILLIDDIQFIAGKESTQEEFFHTFNTLYDAHKQIIISSDRHPKEISTLEERLVSRFGWGLITDIQPPDIETRIAILHKKLEKENIVIPEDVIIYIANTIKTNIRELEGALIRVIAFSMLEKKPISMEIAQDILKNMIKEETQKISHFDILNKVAQYFDISISDIKSKKRSKNMVLPRQIAIYLIREMTSLSLPEIGIEIGGKDHTTVLHACKKIAKARAEDPQIDKMVTEITEKIKNSDRF